MWIVAGALLGATLLAGLVGLHAGPHLHLVAALAGLAAAGWLVAMALAGTGSALVYVLLGADVTFSAGVGIGGWRALRPGTARRPRLGAAGLEGEEGVAVSPLRPDGVVRVRGEEWSAHALNGSVPRGGRIQVIRADGVRLEVWGEEGGAA